MVTFLEKLKGLIGNISLFGFACYGFLWTAIESVTYFFPELKLQGWLSYLVLSIISLFYGVWHSWPKSSIEIKVPNSDSSVIIEFGDILKKEGCVAIAVNDCFDSGLGEHISPNSLHGKFIAEILGSTDLFDSLVEKPLSRIDFEEVQRASGKRRRYAVGTAVPVDFKHTKYFLFVLTKTNIQTLKVSASLHEYWDSLAGLWSSIRNYSNGYPIFIPLIGSGLSGIGLPPNHLIKVIMISFFYFTKESKITDKLTLVLHPSFKDKINLEAIEQDWS